MGLSGTPKDSLHLFLDEWGHLVWLLEGSHHEFNAKIAMEVLLQLSHLSYPFDAYNQIIYT